MVPYYKEKNCTIYNANCRDILPSLDRFDLLLTTAPQYPAGLSDDNKARMASGWRLAGQSNPIGMIPEAELLMAIGLADNAIVWQPDAYKLPSGESLHWISNKSPFCTAWHNISNPRTWCWGPTAETDRLSVMTQFIHFTPKADTILDPFMDEGDVLIAAMKLGRKFVGIEIDQQRCESAVNWLQECKKTRWWNRP